MKRKSELFVFDLGRVLLRIDPTKCYNSFLTLGIPKDYETRLKSLFTQYEAGQLNENKLLKIVNQETDSCYDYEQFWGCWDQMIIDYIPEMVDQLKRLRKKYLCVLLSNTNARHQKVFEGLFQTTFGYPMSEAFDALFYSHEMSCAKPSSEIYRIVEDKMEVDATKIYFFDDLLDNILAAQNRGWNTYHVTSDVQLTLDHINGLEKELV